jgi:cytochrome c biogenesis factor
MKNFKDKLRTIILLFFAIFGGTMILKYVMYNNIINSNFKIGENIYEQAFIALFVSILLVIGNGIKVSWNTDKSQ